MERLSDDAILKYQFTRDAHDKSVFCHAPFTSLNFSINGEVTACCCNRDTVLGRYPEKSIAEIWAGAPIESLRADMRRWAPPESCGPCRDGVENKNSRNLCVFGYDLLSREKLDSARPWPRMMTFETSNTCNLECIMCTGKFSSLIRRNRDKLPPIPNPYGMSFVEELEPFLPHLREAKFLGGEPFLNSIYFELWDQMARINPAIAIDVTTNGSILTPKVEKFLNEMKPSIVVSVDSLDRANYERIRINADYDMMRANVERFIEHSRRTGKVFRLIACPMRQNWMDLPTLLEFCHERDIHLGFTTVTGPPDCTLMALDPDKLLMIAKYLASRELQEEPGWSLCRKGNLASYRGMYRQIAAWSLLRPGVGISDEAVELPNPAFLPQDEHRAP